MRPLYGFCHLAPKVLTSDISISVLNHSGVVLLEFKVIGNGNFLNALEIAD
jgi:hypothetical protein